MNALLLRAQDPTQASFHRAAAMHCKRLTTAALAVVAANTALHLLFVVLLLLPDRVPSPAAIAVAMLLYWNSEQAVNFCAQPTLLVCSTPCAQS
jgi:hypothetical protein